MWILTIAKQEPEQRVQYAMLLNSVFGIPYGYSLRFINVGIKAASFMETILRDKRVLRISIPDYLVEGWVKDPKTLYDSTEIRAHVAKYARDDFIKYCGMMKKLMLTSAIMDYEYEIRVRTPVGHFSTEVEFESAYVNVQPYVEKFDMLGNFRFLNMSGHYVCGFGNRSTFTT